MREQKSTITGGFLFSYHMKREIIYHFEKDEDFPERLEECKNLMHGFLDRWSEPERERFKKLHNIVAVNGRFTEAQLRTFHELWQRMVRQARDLYGQTIVPEGVDMRLCAAVLANCKFVETQWHRIQQALVLASEK